MKRFKLFALALVLALFMTGCSDYEDYDYDYDYEEDYDDGDDNGSRPSSSSQSTPKATDGLSMTVDGSSGQMQISRANKKSDAMGDAGTWTIFVYLCGTDLESDDGYGAASSDLQQILDAEESEDITFVIQTGGTSDWMNNMFDAGQNERWVINDGDMELVHSEGLSSMGSPKTLSSFLKWGVKEYPAEKMGVVFWDHGGGSITGACFDEMSDSDSLSLAEINEAFSETYAEMTDRFEFIGFDCCLMGTAEVANILATYARYFYGSQEIEPGSGWDYTSIGDFLAENPDANGADLGKVVADSFYNECKKDRQESECTFTIIDLDKVDEFVIAFNSYAQKLYESAKDNLASIVRGATTADNFGGNNRSEGYTNMVDIGGIVNNCSAYADGSEVLKALNNCIVYNINGKNHEGASGLSVYYPLKVQGSNEIGIFSGICISPYYLSLVDMAAKGYSEEGYSNDIFFSDNGDWSNDNGSYDYFDDSYFDDEYYEYGEASELITFAQDPDVDDEGYFGFVLDEDGLYYTSYVTAYIYFDLDEDTMVCIGETDDVYCDWDTGYVCDNFDGYWLSLPNGELLTTYIADWGEDYTVFTSPIKLNGEYTNLRIRQYLDYTLEIEGTWAGIDENGFASREIVPLKAGDVIEPVYYLDDDSDFVNDGYKWRTGDELIYSLLPVGDYYYGFEIFDAYGDSYITDCIVFTVDENGEILFDY